MTEADWLAAKHVEPLMYHKSNRNTRKRRLLACACVRRVAHFLADPIFNNALDISEQHSEGIAKWSEMLEIRKQLRLATASLSQAGALEHQLNAAESFIKLTEKEFMHFIGAIESAAFTMGSHARPNWEEGYAAEQREQVFLGRDIFGNPFRPVAFDPAWRTHTTSGIAAKMYADRNFSAMPILADALEEAGCDSVDVLLHCREPGTHVRGCWVVDLVLDKK